MTKKMVIDIRDDNANIVKTLKKGKKINFRKLKHKPAKLVKMLKMEDEAQAMAKSGKKGLKSSSLGQTHMMSKQKADQIMKATKNMKQLKKLKSLIPDPKSAKYANVEQITIPDVVINEKVLKPGKPLRKILI